jgi:hypothetical protein
MNVNRVLNLLVIAGWASDAAMPKPAVPTHQRCAWPGWERPDMGPGTGLSGSLLGLPA